MYRKVLFLPVQTVQLCKVLGGKELGVWANCAQTVQTVQSVVLQRFKLCRGFLGWFWGCG